MISMRKKPMIWLTGVLVLMLLVGGVSTIAVAAASNSSSETKTEKSGVHVDVTQIAASVLDMTKDEVKAAVKDGKVGDLLIAAGKVDAFKTAYLAELQSKLDAAVTAGTLTREQADAKYASGKEKMDAYDGTTSFRDSAKKESTGGKSHGSKKVSVQVNVIKVAASVLDKTEDEVKAAVKDGKVGDLLIAAGKVDAFKTAYLAEAKSKLDAAVTAGTLTQEQADEKYAAEKAKMDAYDGTTHLCGHDDHSKMFEKKSKTSKSDEAA